MRSHPQLVLFSLLSIALLSSIKNLKIFSVKILKKNSLTFLALFIVTERITPEIFGIVPADGLKFFALYQRYDSLGQAMAELGKAFKPCSLTHNDLKLNNILLQTDWEHSSDNIVRLIDWERSAWGDPAFDLGMRRCQLSANLAK